MRVVSRSAIKAYYTKNSNSKTALEEWHFKINKCNPINLNELKETFGSADFIGNNRVVFNIKGNDYRLIAIVIYASSKVYIRWIGSHAAYDKINAKNI